MSLALSVALIAVGMSFVPVVTSPPLSGIWPRTLEIARWVTTNPPACDWDRGVVGGQRGDGERSRDERDDEERTADDGTSRRTLDDVYGAP